MLEGIFSYLSGYLLIILFFVGWISVPIFLYYSYQNKRKREWVESQEYRLIKISVPKENEKGPLAAEQMFASLHGIFKPHHERKAEGSLQEHISFEICSSNERISFYIWVPTHLKDFIEGQIYAQYPKAEFEIVPDYTDKDFSDSHVVGTEIILNRNEVFPIKTFVNFEEVDPLSGVTSVLSKLDESGEDVWIQILVKPVDDSWRDRGTAYINAVKEGRAPESNGITSSIKSGTATFAKDLFKAAITPPENMKNIAEPPKISSSDEAKLKAIEEKIAKLGFGVKIRVGHITKKADLSSAKIKLRSVIGAFKQFNTTNLNGFQAGSIVIGEQFIKDYKSRLFLDEGYVLNIEELASIFHLPNVSVETPNISWTGSKKGEPPESLPVLTGSEKDMEISVFAETNFRHKKQKFGIKTDDRRRHAYLVGKTGVGKTNMMENMVISDIKAGHGVAVVDPHGDFVDTIIKYIPKNRINDVIIFNPADSEYPIAFNPLEAVNQDQKNLIASGLISIFQKIWAESWGPRLEYILRNTIISMLGYPDSTMLGILKILVDDDYRKRVVNKLDDPVIRDFWTKEFAHYNERTRQDAILPIQNKVGQFLSSSTIRNIVGQPKGKIDMRYIMDNKKILLLKLAQGQIGEDNSSLLGAMMITKMQLAAMSRSDIPEEERIDFYLYVDEFQNFATESFAKILSEARKYHLNLTLTNQYIAQLADASRSDAVKHAVFGNVGSLVCFRVGATDARDLAKELEPVFDENDLVNLDKYHIYVKLSIDGVTGNAFSAKTLKIPEPTEDHSAIMIRNSRERYATVRHVVEEKIAKWAEEISREGEAIESATPINSEHLPDKEKGQHKEDNDSHDFYGGYSKYLEHIKVQLGGSRDEMKQTESKNQDKQGKRQDERNATESSSANKALKIKELTSKIIQHADSNNSKSNNSSDKEDVRQTKGLSRGGKREIKHGEVIKFN